MKHYLSSGVQCSQLFTDQPKLFTIGVRFCWTIYTLLCLIPFWVRVCSWSQWYTCTDTLCVQTHLHPSSYPCPSFLTIWNIYLCFFEASCELWWIITLYDEIWSHYTLHMMNWVPCRQNGASAVFVCVQKVIIACIKMWKMFQIHSPMQCMKVKLWLQMGSKYCLWFFLHCHIFF